jgi:sarcosine oxidase gamma subunit
VSADEASLATVAAPSPGFEIVEICALRGRADDLRALAATHALTLPTMGRAAVAGDTITLCVRPNRWLLLSNLRFPAAWRLRASDSGSPAARRLRASYSGSESESEPEEALNRRAAEIDWARLCEGVGVAIDLSSALTPLQIQDGATYGRLEGGCRLDLDPNVFQEGHAVATIIAQVQVILARLPEGLLVLTPSTTAQHFREWLGEPHP